MPDVVWPIPKFRFEVSMGAAAVAFQEVSGLEMETEFIEYRSGNDQTLLKLKIPGLKKNGTVTLKKGYFEGDNELFNWWNNVQTEPGRREDVVITMLDETNAPVFTWTISNAFPTKFTATDLKSDANEIAIETLELAHEGILQELP